MGTAFEHDVSYEVCNENQDASQLEGVEDEGDGDDQVMDGVAFAERVKSLLAMPGQAVRLVTPLPSSWLTRCLLAMRPNSLEVPYVKMSFLMPSPLHNTAVMQS